MIRIKKLLFLALLFVSVVSCKKDLELSDKYARPDWLAGKLFTQIKSRPELSQFTQCLEITGYDTIINTSGSYTVFAPDNEAFTRYFQSHPQYNSVTDIPTAELSRIVKFHIVQNPWSKLQLKSLDVFGWIDSSDINNDKPKGFKRETLLRERDPKFGVKYNENKVVAIVDTLLTDWYRRQATDSRKYAPIFYNDYFNIFDLNFNDFTFYFERPFDSPDDIYFVNGKITTGDIFAENGFIHIVDRVVEPLKNAYQMLSTKSADVSYSKFLDIVDIFTEFQYNRVRTIAQPGAELGYTVDSLFDISYPQLAFSITNEQTKAPSGTVGLPGNVTIRYHHGVIAPSNDAFDAFVNEYIAGPDNWGSLKETPLHIKRMMANTQMSSNAIYPSDFTKGFYNGEKDMVYVDPSTIIHKEYGSNCSFIGVNKMIVPRAFKSITGPIYLQRGYSVAMYAIEKTGLLPALKKESNNYLLFAESDLSLRFDSSLMYNPINERFSLFQTNGDQFQEFSLSTSDVRTLILNHIGVEIPKGVAKKEYIPNLAGNFLIFNNETGEVSGTAPSTIGYSGQDQVNVFPKQISVNADNGITYNISNWFNFASVDLFQKISTSFPYFHNLLKKAGLTNDKLYTYKFISDNEYYTVFIPTLNALNEYQADTMSIPNLKQFLLFHFVQGDMIFTDGNKPSKYYETARIDEKSTPYTTIFTKVYINPGIDVIDIPGLSASDYINIPESANTNTITVRKLFSSEVGGGLDEFPNVISNAVIHQIDKVILVNEADTQ
jgi:uncharacterized surface protein with fasciclin (FAS1) repeats